MKGLNSIPIMLLSAVLLSSCGEVKQNKPEDALLCEDRTAAYVIIRSDTDRSGVPLAVALTNAIKEQTDVEYYDNFCRLGGYGWGCRGRETSAPMCAMNSGEETCVDNYLTDNIFDRCLGILLRVGKEGTMNFVGNTYIQPYDASFAYLWGTSYKFDGTARETLAKVGETNPTLVYVIEDEEPTEAE